MRVVCKKTRTKVGTADAGGSAVQKLKSARIGAAMSGGRLLYTCCIGSLLRMFRLIVKKSIYFISFMIEAKFNAV